MEFQWNKSFEAGLPSDKEILKNPDDQRTWVVQSAMARVLSEVVALLEAGFEQKKPKK